jgi:hypothetical protein
MEAQIPLITCSDVSPTTYSDKFIKIIQGEYRLNPESNNNKIAQAVKFFLLKGMCRGGMMLSPQRSVLFERSNITFCQKTGNCTPLNRKYIEFYIEEISPFISYTIIEKLKEIYNNKKSTINQSLTNIHFVNINTNLNLTNTGVSQTSTAEAALSAISRFFKRTAQTVSGEKQKINQEQVNQEARKLNKVLELQLLILQNTITLIPGSFSHQRTTNILGRFFDNFTHKIIQLMEGLTERPNRTLSLNLMKIKLNQIEKTLEKINILKSVFNTLCVGKLLWVDRINPNILPFYNNDFNQYLSLLERSKYINTQCKEFLMSQLNRNYLSKFNGLLNNLNQYLINNFHSTVNPVEVNVVLQPTESTSLLEPRVNVVVHNLSTPYSIHHAINSGKKAKQILDELNERLEAGKLQLEIRSIQNARTGEYFDDDGVIDLQTKIEKEFGTLNSISLLTKYNELLKYLSNPKKYRGGKKKKSISTKSKSKKVKFVKK